LDPFKLNFAANYWLRQLWQKHFIPKLNKLQYFFRGKFSLKRIDNKHALSYNILLDEKIIFKIQH